MYYLSKQRADMRERLVFRRPFDPKGYQMGGCVRFDEISPETARELIALDFLDPEDAQNSSPTAEEFVRFCEEHDGDWYLHGYVISPTRDDTRVTIEGIGSRGAIPDDSLIDFIKMCRDADELNAERGCGVYCWYD